MGYIWQYCNNNNQNHMHTIINTMQYHYINNIIQSYMLWKTKIPEQQYFNFD